MRVNSMLLPCVLALLPCACTLEMPAGPVEESAGEDLADQGMPDLPLDWQREYTSWVIIPDEEGPHAPSLYPAETFDLTFVGTQELTSPLAFRCYERQAAPGICITAHCAYGGHSALYWARWCGAGETALIQRPDIVAAVFHVPPVSLAGPAGQGRGIVLEPNPHWHAAQPPPAVCFTGYGLKANGGGWVMVYSAQPDVETGPQ